MTDAAVTAGVNFSLSHIRRSFACLGLEPQIRNWSTLRHPLLNFNNLFSNIRHDVVNCLKPNPVIFVPFPLLSRIPCWTDDSQNAPAGHCKEKKGCV